MRGVEMAAKPEKQSLCSRHRRALRILAETAHGCDVNALLTRGLELETMADLVRKGLATVRVEIIETHGLTIEVARLRITDVGRRALEGGAD
jgi:hypothetical protein